MNYNDSKLHASKKGGGAVAHRRLCKAAGEIVWSAEGLCCRRGALQAPSAGQQGLIASSMIRRMVRAQRPHSALQPRQR